MIYNHTFGWETNSKLSAKMYTSFHSWSNCLIIDLFFSSVRIMWYIFFSYYYFSSPQTVLIHFFNIKPILIWGSCVQLIIGREFWSHWNLFSWIYIYIYIYIYNKIYGIIEKINENHGVIVRGWNLSNFVSTISTNF